MRRFQLALVWLVATSVLIQSVWAGVPAGLSLCIGCDEGGWSISQSEAPTAAKDCCAGESERTDTSHAPAIGRDECGCVRIPVTGSEGVTLLASRMVSPAGDTPVLTSVVAFVPLAMMAGTTPKARPPRAGPESPPRLLTPMSRCTVLLL